MSSRTGSPKAIPTKPSTRPPAKWSLIHSTVVPSNVTVVARDVSQPGESVVTGRKQCASVPLSPAVHAYRWYESSDRSLPSVSSF